MSYCRFSSDGYKSDVYVYEADDGVFICHIASNRFENAQDAPPTPTLDDIGEKGAEKYLRMLDEFHTWLDTHAVRKKIVHEMAGKTIEMSGPSEMANFLQRLRGEGFYVPQYAIEALLDEAEEG